MKKTVAVLSTFILMCTGLASAQEVVFSEDTGGVYYPLQLALYPTVQLVPYDGDFAGLRLNIIGANRNVSGVDIGLINQTDDIFRGVGIGAVNLSKGNSEGLSIGLINHANGDVKGFQGIPFISWWSAFNFVHGQCNGAQGGLFNQASTLRGVQGGLVNVAYDSKGVMVGLYNYTESFCGLHVGLVNITYNDMTGAQFGIYNGVRDARGFQLGLINQCQTLDGLQIGLVNIASQKESLPTMLFVNWQF
ncbi:LA_2272 family surface repeat-containing protein [Tichowtungia aerotolerans]|uniref:PhaC PHA synthase n=1 Tax=Tichowtungia aerotolerans TaxID=2697043 RepID=A0A6P1M6T9_9BACT|nr:hypothetical protein [Tichowtungia aerotolerans]QHI70300.1 hypothetical protein GT409_12895 [Tichowtungia aerotolerans]